MNRRKFVASSCASAAAFLVCEGRFSLAEEEPPSAPTDGFVLSPELRQKLMHDPLRPQFHLLPKANWMNDPCAPRLHGDEYHMFFQYNPAAAVWGNMHWAHAKSPDLIHWTHLPMALSPTPDRADAFGCFTGSVLPGMTTPTVLYTGVTRSSPDRETIRGEGLREVQCLATSNDPELLVWKKLDKPVLDSPPPGLKITGFRDPCPWNDGGIWYLAIGSGFSKIGGAVLLYRSSDGRNWTYLHPLAQGQWNGGNQVNPVDTGEMWECPDFFPLGGKHVLLYSSERKVYWEVGEFDKRDLKFHRQTTGRLDHGSYYAMKSMVDAQGRRILWGWVEETRSAEECRAAGWAGAMALPRLLSLTADNMLKMEVLPEFSSLLRETKTLPGARRADVNATLAELPIANRAGKLTVTFRTSEGTGGLKLCASREPDAAALLDINVTRSATQPSVKIANQEILLAPDHEGISTIDLWIDGSVIEAFLDGREAMTARCYKPVAGDIRAAWTGRPETLKSLTVSQVAPISPDRLTS